jgi:hypothetical protein
MVSYFIKKNIFILTMIKTVVHLGIVFKGLVNLFKMFLLYKFNYMLSRMYCVYTCMHHSPAYKSISIKKILPLYKMVCLSDISLIVASIVPYPILT